MAVNLFLCQQSGVMQNQQDTITDKGIFLSYEKYLDWVATDPLWKQKAKSMTSVWIYNPNGVLILRGGELPPDGMMFEQTDKLSAFKNVKELYLSSLHVNDLPDSFIQLQKLEKLELAFTVDANIKHIIKVLSQLKSLKKLNIDASTLTTKHRKAFIKEMEKKGVHFNGAFN